MRVMTSYDHCIALSRMKRIRFVFRRRIDRIEFQRVRSRHVDNIVTGAGRYDDRVSAGDIIQRSVEQCLPLAGDASDELVMIGMNFFSDFLADRNRHDNQLHFRPRIQNLTKIRILSCLLFDISKKVIHSRHIIIQRLQYTTISPVHVWALPL